MLVYKCILLSESNVSLLQRLDFLNGAHIETVSFAAFTHLDSWDI